MSAAPWETLAHFATEYGEPGTPVGRDRLAEAVSSLCATPDRDLNRSETRLAFEILERLYPQIERAVRRSLADRLSGRTDIPPSLVRLLAHDSIDIARPILVNSPVLGDEDLIHIVIERGHEHRVAISQRAVLSVRITDVLLMLGDDAIALTLAQNAQASLSGHGLRRLLLRARHCQDLHWPLARRPELTPAIASTLALWAGQAVRDHIAAKFGDRLARTVSQEIFAASEDAIGVFRRNRPHGAETPAVPLVSMFDTFLKAVRTGDGQRADQAMARLTRLPAPAVAQILYTPAGKALAVVCRSSGVSVQVFTEVYSRLNGIAPYGTSQRHDDVASALRTFERISAAEADRIVDGWRADPASVWE